MINYAVIKNDFIYDGDIYLGKELNIVINKQKITIYDLNFQKIFITNKIYKKYLKLLRLVNFYLASDDETGTAIHEALNEIEKFRQLVKNKYRNYLLSDTLKIMSKELSTKVIIANKKLNLIEHKTNNYNNETKRSK